MKERSRRQDDGRLVLLLLVIPLVLFGRVLFDPDALVAFDDIVRQFYPWRVFAQGLPGQPPPMWLPFPTTGEPLLPNAQVGLFYPPDGALEAILPVHRALTFGLVLHLWLMGAGMYVLARHMIGDRASAFLAACTLMLSQFVIAHMHAGHYSMVTATAWLPLVFLFGKRAVDDNDFRAALWMAVSVALQLLAGHPQVSYLTLALTGSYVAFVLARRVITAQWRVALRDAVMMAGAVGLGVGLAAIQLVPILEFSKVSTRAGGLDFGMSSLYSLPIHGLSGLVLPQLFGNPLTNSYLISGPYWEFAIYVGVLPLILCGAATLLRRLDPPAWFLGAVGVVALVLMLGNHTPLYRLAWKLVPGISTFRVPARFDLLLTFVLAIFAAYGLAGLNGKLSDRTRIWIRRFAHLCFVVAGVAAVGSAIALTRREQLLDVVAGFFTQGPGRQEAPEWYLQRLPGAYSSAALDILLLTFLAAGAGLLLRWRAASAEAARWFALAACAMVVVNLAIYAQPMVRARPVHEVYRPTALESFLQKHAGGYRVYDRANVHLPGAETVQGIRMLEGYNPMRLQDFYRVLRSIRESPLERSQGVLNVLSARYVISDRTVDLPWLSLAFTDSGTFVYENTTALPRAFVVASGDRDVNLMGAGREEAGRGASADGVRITAETPNEFTIEADVTAPATLVLSEVAYPGWRAFVDEEPRPMLVAFGVLRSVEIGAGRHTVRVVYEPASVTFGRWITAGSGAVLAIAIVVALTRRRRTG